MAKSVSIYYIYHTSIRYFFSHNIYDHPKSSNPVKISFHCFLVLSRYAKQTPYLWDKIRIWFMPAGWRPRGVPKKELQEITIDNQVKFRTEMFDNSVPFLIVRIAAGVALMLGAISHLAAWTTVEGWIGAGLLWWHIINWSGILEPKLWLWTSENVRIIVTVAALVVFKGPTQPSTGLILLTAISAFSIVWTNLYFRPTYRKLVPA
ncbi:MAG: hypothetical protein C4324_12175 [Blastocatellia bacterium]